MTSIFYTILAQQRLINTICKVDLLSSYCPFSFYTKHIKYKKRKSSFKSIFRASSIIQIICALLILLFRCGFSVCDLWDVEHTHTHIIWYVRWFSFVHINPQRQQKKTHLNKGTNNIFMIITVIIYIWHDIFLCLRLLFSLFPFERAHVWKREEWKLLFEMKCFFLFLKALARSNFINIIWAENHVAIFFFQD